MKTRRRFIVGPGRVAAAALGILPAAALFHACAPDNGSGADDSSAAAVTTAIDTVDGRPDHRTLATRRTHLR